MSVERRPSRFVDGGGDQSSAAKRKRRLNLLAGSTERNSGGHANIMSISGSRYVLQALCVRPQDCNPPSA